MAALAAWRQRLRPLMAPFQPLVDAVQLWLQVDGLRMSAAMTFYGLLSLSPLVLLIVGLLGWWMDRSVVESTLLAQVTEVMGERGASVVQAALSSAQAPSEGRIASIVAFVLLLSGATGVFVELQTALDKLWQWGREPEPEPPRAWWKLATLRLRGLAYVMVVGFLLLVTMVLSTALQLLMRWASSWFDAAPPGVVLQLVNESVSLLLITALFMGLMRIGTGPKPSLRYLLVGALCSAVLFTVSKFALGWYLSTAAVVSAYGAAGSIVVVLMWIYVSSAILLLGASLAKALAQQAAHPEPIDGRKHIAPMPSYPRSIGSREAQHWPQV